MTARTTTLALAFALTLALAFTPTADGQTPKDGEKSRLTVEAAKKMKDGIGKMTAEEALKLVPGPVSVKADAASTMIPGGTADYVLLWDEARRVRLTFASGKVTVIEASFPESAGKGGVLSPASVAEVKLGMAKEDALKALKAEKKINLSHSTKVLNKGSVEEFAEGRWIRAVIKDGKVADVAWSL